METTKTVEEQMAELSKLNEAKDSIDAMITRLNKMSDVSESPAGQEWIEKTGSSLSIKVYDTNFELKITKSQLQRFVEMMKGEYQVERDNVLKEASNLITSQK
jgi:hypothetical protein